MNFFANYTTELMIFSGAGLLITLLLMSLNAMFKGKNSDEDSKSKSSEKWKKEDKLLKYQEKKFEKEVKVNKPKASDKVIDKSVHKPAAKVEVKKTAEESLVKTNSKIETTMSSDKSLFEGFEEPPTAAATMALAADKVEVPVSNNIEKITKTEPFPNIEKASIQTESEDNLLSLAKKMDFEISKKV